MTRKWNEFRAEYRDVRRNAAHKKKKRPCIYCGAMTTATSQICPSHEDLAVFEGNDLMWRPDRESDHL